MNTGRDRYRSSLCAHSPRTYASIVGSIDRLVGTLGVRPRTGRRTAPKLSVALAAASIAASQRDGSTAAAMKASAGSRNRRKPPPSPPRAIGIWDMGKTTYSIMPNIFHDARAESPSASECRLGHVKVNLPRGPGLVGHRGDPGDKDFWRLAKQLLSIANEVVRFW